MNAMSTYLIRIILLMGFVLCFTESRGQQATAKLSREQILIGQQADLNLEIVIPAGGTLLWPAIADTLTRDIEIIRFGRPDTLQRNDHELRLSQTHSITAWEEGYFPIPPIVFGWIHQGDTIRFETAPLLLQSGGVTLDPEAPPKDIKPVLTWPLTLRELLPYVLLLLLFAVLSFYIYYRIKNRQKIGQTVIIPAKPDVPAHIAALSALESLRSKKLWQKGQLKAHHSELTDILRKYLKKRYAIEATEMTTEEIMYRMQYLINDSGCREWLAHILSVADLVKFARHQPDAEENERIMDRSIDLVQKTKGILENAD